jgi:hypothetical protein
MEVYLREYFESWNRIYKGGMNMFHKFFNGRKKIAMITALAVMFGILLTLPTNAGLILNNHKFLVLFMATPPGDPAREQAKQARIAAVTAAIQVREAFTNFLSSTGLYEQAELAKLLGDEIKMRALHNQAVESSRNSLKAIEEAINSYKQHQEAWLTIHTAFKEGKLSPEARRAYEAFLKAAAEIGWSIEADFAGYFDYLGRLKIQTIDYLQLIEITPPCFPIQTQQQQLLEAQARNTFKEWLQALAFVERVSALSTEATRRALKSLGL